MSEHTPGPWRIEPHYKCGWKGTAKDPTPNRWQAIYVSGQERGAKGIVVNIGIKGGEVDDYWLSIKEADARLIEAAPTMLATLKEAEAMFRWYGDLHAAKPDHNKAKRNYDMADKCAAAIAEAEGGDNDHA